MTVPSEQSRIQYTTDGTSVSFPVPFRFLNAAHLQVARQHNDESSILELGVDYSVSGVGNQAGGTITTTTTLPAGDSISIERVVPITQETAYQRNDPFPERAHEQALDKLTMICQMLGSILGVTPGSMNRALLLGAGDINGSGSYRANGNRIGNLGAPKLTTDAARKQDILEALASLSVDGSGQFVIERLADSSSLENGSWMIGNSVIPILSISELVALPAENRRSDVLYFVRGYHFGSTVGGGVFIYDQSSGAEDNGGTVFAPDDSVGDGRYIRIPTGVAEFEWFGAKGVGGDDSDALEAAAVSGVSQIKGRYGSVYGISRGIVFPTESMTIYCEAIGYYKGAEIKSLAPRLKMITFSSFGSNIRGFQITGYEDVYDDNSFGQISTCDGVTYLRDNLSKDIDAFCYENKFMYLRMPIMATGANLKVFHNLFMACANGAKLQQVNTATDFRGFCIENNRFHNVGGPESLDGSACIIVDGNARGNRFVNNYADFCGTFFSGQLGRQSSLSGNTTLSSRRTAVKISESPFPGGQVIGNSFDFEAGRSDLVYGDGIVCDCPEVQISENYISRPRGNGIVIKGSQVNVENNFIQDLNYFYQEDGPIYSGIVVEGTSTWSSVRNNRIRNRLNANQALAGVNNKGTSTLIDSNFTQGCINKVLSTKAFRGSGAWEDGRRIEYSVEAPTTGSWNQGDIVYRANPAPSLNIGWVCTQSGTPGTWKNFGTISS